MERIRSHVTYANVLSTMAIFIVLGGGAYAAATLPKNSVGTKQLKNGAVTKKKLAKGVLTAGPKGDTGPQGLKGDKGDKGADGTNGLNGANGKDGTNGQDGGRGPSDLYINKGLDVADLDNTTGSTLASVIVPSGKYLVQAKVNLTATALTTVDCIIFTSGHAGTPIDSATVTIAANAKVQVNLIGDENLGANFVLFSCDDNGGTAAASAPRITALQVATVH